MFHFNPPRMENSMTLSTHQFPTNVGQSNELRKPSEVQQTLIELRGALDELDRNLTMLNERLYDGGVSMPLQETKVGVGPVAEIPMPHRQSGLGSELQDRAMFIRMLSTRVSQMINLLAI